MILLTSTNVPRTVAYYIRIAAIILLVYAGLRILFAFMFPFAPVPDFDCCCGVSCVKVVMVSGQAVGGFTKMLSKPWVHVPLTFGICLILLVVLWLNPAIDQLDVDIHKPLIECDIQTAAFISEINAFIVSISDQVIDWVNAGVADAWSKVRIALVNTMFDMFLDVNNVILNDIQTPIDTFMHQLTGDNSLYFTFPTFGAEDSPVTIPKTFIPPIPYIPVQDLTIPPDILGISKPVSPWIEQQIQQLRDIANSILQFGIWLVVLPGIALCFGFGKAFVPRKVNDFFTHPDFYEQDNVDKAETELTTNPPKQDRQLP